MFIKADLESSMRRSIAKQALKRGGEEDMEVIRYDLRTLEVGTRASALGCCMKDGRETIRDDAAAGDIDAVEACRILLVCTFRFVRMLCRNIRPPTRFKCRILGRIFVDSALMLLSGVT